jgi:hypothetical protein
VEEGAIEEPDTKTYRLGDTITFAATVEHNFVMDDARAVLALQEESLPPETRRLVLPAVQITEQKRVDLRAKIISRVQFQATVNAELPEGEYHLRSIEGYPFGEGGRTSGARGITLDMPGVVVGLRIMKEPITRGGRVTERKFEREPTERFFGE